MFGSFVRGTFQLIAAVREVIVWGGMIPQDCGAQNITSPGRGL